VEGVRWKRIFRDGRITKPTGARLTQKGPVMKSSQSRSASSAFIPAVTLAAAVLLLLAFPAPMQAGNDNRSPDVPAPIQVPGGTNKVHFHAYAVGVQIYVWTVNPTNAALSSWVFKAPEAVLFADAGTHGEIGIH